MTSKERARYVDPRTGKHHELSERRWRSDDGNPMLVTPLPGISRDDIDSRERSLWRYRAALPVVIERPASMGEGCTPLVQKRWGGLEPYFKLEWFNPTCSFKDRGAAVMMSFLRQIGVDAVLYEANLPLRQMMNLKVGDTLPLEIKSDSMVTVRCGNVTLTEGRMGRVGDRVAVRVAKPLRKPKTTFAMFEKADERTNRMEGQ